MIVYQATKKVFQNDILQDVIEHRILEQFKLKLNRSIPRPELISYRNSLGFMDRVLQDSEIPDDCGVALEYHLPQSSKRVDFILTGANEKKAEQLIIIELKQWSTATRSEKDGVVITYVGGRNGEFTHPSYQAWSYSSLLKNFNATVETDSISLLPCAFLHNYMPDDVMTHDHYKDYLEKAPLFLRGEAPKLREFIKKHVKYGDQNELLVRIDKSKQRPSKYLADCISSMLKGNREFVLIDDQKLVLEEAVALSAKTSNESKKVLIVKGGPGTGKSVVAINILERLTNKGLYAKCVSRNAAPRQVYERKLTKTFKKTEVSHLFGGVWSFYKTPPNSYDAVIVDEAHRLNDKSELYSNMGESQVKEIINSARLSVFFIDEDQRVTLKDVGTIDEIRKHATDAQAEVIEMELASQFRCNGSDGYLAWLDNALQIRRTANETLHGINYEFKVFSSPVDLWNAIYEKNKVNNRSRVVAGYCWDWKSKKSKEANDIIIDPFDFKMKWNLDSDGPFWIIAENSINEIGCIHTCQGLETDYIGVIIGNDLVARNGKLVVQPEARSKGDQTIKGYKKLLKESPGETQRKLDAIIKNTYKTLMTRGAKGCYVYCVDEELGEYLRQSNKDTSDKVTH
jgi:DUF2075 family protein